MDSPGVDMPKARGRLLPVLGLATLAVAVLCITVLTFADFASLHADDEFRFQAFEVKFGKKYASEAERSYRLEVFKENGKRSAEYQRENPLASFGVTKFADMTQEEISRRFAARKTQPTFQHMKREQLATGLPSTFDWRNSDIVRPVQDVGSCISDYAVSVASAVESMWAIETNQFLMLSEQQIIDCSDYTQGCQGGDTVAAFEYVVDSGGLQPAFAYPSTGMNKTCSIDEYYTKLYVDAFVWFSGNEVALQQNLYLFGPIAVTLNVDSSFMLYTGGTLETCGQGGYEVSGLLVGYGYDWWTNYWVVQMSFGEAFGDGGMVYLERDATNQGSGVCGITNQALHPHFFS